MENGRAGKRMTPVISVSRTRIEEVKAVAEVFFIIVWKEVRELTTDRNNERRDGRLRP